MTVELRLEKSLKKGIEHFSKKKRKNSKRIWKG